MYKTAFTAFVNEILHLGFMVSSPASSSHQESCGFDSRLWSFKGSPHPVGVFSGCSCCLLWLEWMFVLWRTCNLSRVYRCVCVRACVCVCLCLCVRLSVCTFSGLRQSYAAASWLSLKLSGLAYLPCQLHSLWQPDDMGLCDGHDPPDVPPTHPPTQASQQSDWLSEWSQKRADSRKVLGFFFFISEPVECPLK